MQQTEKNYGNTSAKEELKQVPSSGKILFLREVTINIYTASNSMQLLIIILIFFFCGLAEGRQDSTVAADTVHSVIISVYSQPENAKVYLDTNLIGITPLKDYKITSGEYVLKIITPYSPSVWESENKIFKINFQRDTVINVAFRFFYYFDSDPFNANIYKSDTLFGITPFRYLSDVRLTGNLIFKKSNHRDFIYDLDDYDFENGAVIKLISKGKESVNDIVMKNKSTQFKTKRNLYYVLGFGTLSLTGAFLSVNFKNNSNSNYEKYLSTGDKFYLDESNKNDKYFIASVILMQLAIGGLIYFLFFD